MTRTLFFQVQAATTAMCLAAMSAPVNAWEIIDFDEVPLAANSVWRATAVDQSPLVSHGVEFNRSWNTEFDCCPSGWAVSNQRDQATPGPSGAYSAFVAASNGGGLNSTQFAVANNQVRGEARIAFPEPSQVQGMYVTNVTYTYLATVDGNDGAGFVKGPFQSGDWLRLDAVGLDGQGQETGRSAIYLVDYRGDLESAIDQWTWFDLTPLGSNVSAMEFEMSSTDNGPFGMNTPAFFAVDDLTFHVVPEPSGVAGLLTGVFVLMLARHLKVARPFPRWRCDSSRLTP